MVVAKIENLGDKTKFEKHLKKEGFNLVENEPFAYEAKSTTPIPHTRAFIHEVFSKALSKTTSKECKIILQLSSNPLEAYSYDYEHKFFNQIKI